MPSELAHGRDVGNLLGVGIECKVLGHLPQEYLSIFGAGSDNAVVERIPMRQSAISNRRQIREWFCLLTSRCREP